MHDHSARRSAPFRRSRERRNPVRALLAAPILAAGLLVAAPATANDGAVDAAVAEARAKTGVGAPEEALELLRGLPGEGGDRTAVLFETGLAAVAAAGREGLAEDERATLLDEAIAAFRTILIDRPELVRVRLELARAFFLKGEDSLSRRHFEQVLAGDPPAAVVANVRRYLAAMRARKRWTGYFGFSVAPDSNVNRASDTEIVWIDTAFGRLAFRRNAESFSRSGVGVSVWAGGEYQLPLGERLRLRAGADAARLDYKGSAFDRTFGAAHLGPRWLAGEATEFSLLADARRQWTGSVPLSDEIGARLEAYRTLSRRLGVGATLGLRRRDYRRGDALDGPVADLALDAGWAATPIVRAGLSAGYARERPKARDWRSASRWGRVSASVFLPLGFTVGASGEWRRTDYEGGGDVHLTMDGGGREDRMRILRATVLNRAATLFGFSPQLAVVGETLRSNAQAVSYRRNRAELRAVRQF